MDEVLDRLPDDVRQLLLRTSVLERVNGPLADLLSGSSGGERMLQELEGANAFVVSIDAQRSWFRHHRLFADLLQLGLRQTEPAELPVLHRRAAGWLAEHGYPVEAVGHAQTAGSEVRVLRYLPTNLSAPDLAGELYLGVSTVKTHIHHIYAKLGVHRRAEAVERARLLGLLVPASLTRR